MGNKNSRRRNDPRPATSVDHHAVDYVPVATHDTEQKHKDHPTLRLRGSGGTMVASGPMVAVPSPSPVPLVSLNPYSSVLAYKVADYSKDRRGKTPLLNVYVLVWLQVPVIPGQIMNSDKGYRLTEANQIKKSTKYCTPEARVLGIQFLGEPGKVKMALKAYQENQGYVTSKFDGTFHYAPEQVVEEKNFGEAGRGGCVQGIHFYIDIKSATEFGGCGDCVDRFPVITRRFTDRRKGMIQAIDSAKVRKSAFGKGDKMSEENTQWQSSQLKPKDWTEIVAS